MDKNQLEEHLRFAQELGVAGVSRDPLWRARAVVEVEAAPIAAPPAEPRPVTIVRAVRFQFDPPPGQNRAMSLASESGWVPRTRASPTCFTSLYCWV